MPSRGRHTTCTGYVQAAILPLAAAAMLATIGLRAAHAQRRSRPPIEPRCSSRRPPPPTPPSTDPAQLVDRWTNRQGLSSALQIMLLLTVLSLAPALLLMTTSFVRIIVVLGLLRQALGTQQLPPSQVITSLALFMTLLIMAPVWKQVYDDAIAPYTQEKIGLEDAWQRGQAPLRRFMSAQIERAGNEDDVCLFLDYLTRRARHADPRPKYVYYGPARPGRARRAAPGPAAGVHAQRAEDVVSDRLSDLLAVLDPGPRGLQRARSRWA